MANLIHTDDSVLGEMISACVNYPGRDNEGNLLDPLKPVMDICDALELLQLDFGDSLHRGTPLLDPPTPSPEQAQARRWRQYECDKIQADIYRAQERRP